MDGLDYSQHPFFQGLDKDVPLHLMESTAYKSGMVALRYEVRKPE